MATKAKAVKHDKVEIAHTCANCKFWGAVNAGNINLHECTVKRQNVTETTAWVITGHSSVFYTRYDFGCNLFEKG
jgi:hypothetical protein